MKKYSFLGLVLLVFCLSACQQKTTQGLSSNLHPYHYKIQKKITVDSAAVVSAHPLASEVGRNILRQGGNAIDAAIAMQYALAVVYPNAGNIGGGGFMVIHTAKGENVSIDFREMAPASASRTMYLDSAGKVIPRMSLDGHFAPGVPGTVAGAFLAHKKYGKLSMQKLLAPAIQLAEKGFVITQQLADLLNSHQKGFQKFNTVANVFEKNEPWKAGDTLLQKELAATLKRIAKEGQKGFYEGKTAQLIVDEMKRGGGLITLNDLKNYKAVVRKPRIFHYKGYKIVAMGLPSSGGILLEQMLRMLAPYNLKEMGYHSASTINHVVEVERRAYADRSKYLGDPDFVKVPIDMLLDSTYLRKRMANFVPGKAGKSKNVKPGIKESEETTHLSVLDQYGNAVSVTTTLNTNFGSKVVVGHAGFFLNNEMDDFSAKPGVPNTYGLLGTEANAIQPHKRMLSSMTPTIVLKNNQPYMVVGTPGGSTIITSVLQSILDVLVFDLPPKQAVDNPKYHHQWYPDVVFVEHDFPQSVRLALQKMGYVLKERGAIGRTELILKKGDTLIAVGDKRGDDSASGF